MSQDRTKDRILAELKTQGPRTAQHIAETFSISLMGAHKALQTLVDEELVDSFDQSAGRGRPRRFFKLTTDGHQRFPDNHAHLSIELVADISEEFGAAGMDRLIARREKRQFSDYAKSVTGTLEDRLVALAEIRADEGYMARVVKNDDGSFLLVEDHCPICAIAEACQGFCRSELSIFQAVLGDDVLVERTEHLLSEGRRCSYKISPKSLALNINE